MIPDCEWEIVEEDEGEFEGVNFFHHVCLKCGASVWTDEFDESDESYWCPRRVQ